MVRGASCLFDPKFFPDFCRCRICSSENFKAAAGPLNCEKSRMHYLTMQWKRIVLILALLRSSNHSTDCQIRIDSPYRHLRWQGKNGHRWQRRSSSAAEVALLGRRNSAPTGFLPLCLPLQEQQPKSAGKVAPPMRQLFWARRVPSSTAKLAPHDMPLWLREAISCGNSWAPRAEAIGPTQTDSVRSSDSLSQNGYG